MKILIILPILIPFVTAIIGIILRPWNLAQRILGVIGSASLLAAGLILLKTVSDNGIQAEQLGGWTAPYGISLVADLFASIMVVLAGIIGFAVSIYSLASMDEGRIKFGYFPLLNIMLMGICGAFLTGDIFNLYVWFEVLLISSFVLLALGGEKGQIEGAVKYVTLNLISSAFFLAGLGILYGNIGTLNMADLSQKISASPQSFLMDSSAILFLIAFGIKAAVFPLFFWLPASYHRPPVAVSAIFAGLLTKVGVYALIRVFTLVFLQDQKFTLWLLMMIAAFTMMTGVLGAVSQNNFRRLLSFHIVSQIGYMIMGLALFSPLALAGSVFYIIHHIIVKTNLFLVSGITNILGGSDDLKKLGGIYRKHPFICILFIIPAFSLAGIPPLSGFFAKLILIKAGLNAEQYWLVAIALIASILTLFSMTKVWAEVFWKKNPAEEKVDKPETVKNPKLALTLLIIPIVCLALLTIYIGFSSQQFFELATRTSEQLLNPSEYINTVLGEKHGQIAMENHY